VSTSGALQRIKRLIRNHIRFIGFKKFPDRLLGTPNDSYKYQEGQSYGIEYFYAEATGDTVRMGEVQGIVADADVLGQKKEQDKPRFQQDFKVAYALMKSLREVERGGYSPLLSPTGLTPANAQVLTVQVITSFQDPGRQLKAYMDLVRSHLASFTFPVLSASDMGAR
jgi:hypothetical protein